MPAGAVACGASAAAAAAAAAAHRPACKPGACARPPAAPPAAAAARRWHQAGGGGSGSALCHTCQQHQGVSWTPAQQRRAGGTACGSSGSGADERYTPEEDQSIKVKCMLAAGSGKLDLAECELAAVPPRALDIPGACSLGLVVVHAAPEVLGWLHRCMCTAFCHLLLPVGSPMQSATSASPPNAASNFTLT